MEPKLREEIDSLRHRAIAKKQLELHQEKLKIRDAVVELANDQLKESPAKQDDIVSGAQLTLDLARQRLRDELEVFMDYQEIEKELRNNALTDHLRSRAA